MSAHRTDMHRIQELIRLHRQGVGSRQIARQLEMGRGTIRQYVRRIRARACWLGRPRTSPTWMPYGSSRALLRPEFDSASSVEAFGQVIRDLSNRGVGMTAIHDRLRLEHAEYQGSLSAVNRFRAALKRSRSLDGVSLLLNGQCASISS